ncbi:hypothetical protein IEQ34_012014 [Dendrobium chrysotoxum]|uniref:Uncharacterized protein n=1 Tax=Dendrobium chrysotoxum TaxID=161865 RepID=A0AAV7GVB3_DENCH|nr:hypothetical protein IEQ34_012014 [Dendrobium chrysotoxum]
MTGRTSAMVGTSAVIGRNSGGGRQEPQQWSAGTPTVVDRNLSSGRQEPWQWSVARELPNSSLLSEASVEIVVKLLRNVA